MPFASKHGRILLLSHDTKRIALALGPFRSRARFELALPLFDAIGNELIASSLITSLKIYKPERSERIKSMGSKLRAINRAHRIDFLLILLDSPQSTQPVTIVHYNNPYDVTAMNSALLATPEGNGYNFVNPNPDLAIEEKHLHLLTLKIPALALSINFSPDSPAKFLFQPEGIVAFAQQARDGIYRAAAVYT